jgi:transcriptional regulator GlxA family with amidase domain
MKSQRHQGQAEQAILIGATSSATLERHFSVAEIAAMWNLSKDAVRRMFQNEPGVLVLGDTSPRRRKRPYTTLRIPQSVVQRVHLRCSLVSY